MAQSSANVVTRFAPSPTGFLHIGGARTALFNWLYARRHNGKFLLRIEDTDRARSTDEAIDAILKGMEWLGLDHDGEAISQFARRDRHAEVAQQLLDAGNAYYCYASPEELDEARQAAKDAGGNFRGDLWRDRDPAEAPEGVKPTVRVRMPREGSTIIEDEVQGRVEVSNETLDDMVLLRSDGTPTYMLSVVVDDYDMGVTHVVRGDDHLNNMFRQAAIYKLMGWELPVFAHIPLIHGPDGKKLSKRHGALGVEAYRDMGFLPEAMRNYLLRLGWSHGDEEIISTEQAIEWFNLESIGASPSRFDFDKLDHLNSHYLRSMSADDLVTLITPTLEKELDKQLTEIEVKRLVAALPSVAERASRIPDLADAASLYCDVRPISLNEAATKLLSGENIKDLMSALAQGLKGLDDWNAANAKSVMSDYAKGNELKLGKVMQPVRAALTGGKPSGDLGEIMEILGQAETVARLQDQAA